MFVIFMVDGLGYTFLPQNGFIHEHSKCLLNSIPTITSPNWCTLLTGLEPSEHGVLDNDDPKKKRDWRFNHSTFIDDFIDKIDERVLIVSDWNVFDRYTHLQKHKDSVEFQHAHDVFRTVHEGILSGQYGLIIGNYSRLDTVGHRYTWTSSQYSRSVRNIDRRMRDICTKHHNVLFLAVADHGGDLNCSTGDENCGHYHEEDENTRKVPLFSYPTQSVNIQKNVQFRKWIKRLFDRINK